MSAENLSLAPGALAGPAAAVRGGFRDALRRLDGAQKPGDGVPAYTRWINRRLARYVAAASYRVGLTPNAVSIISFGLSAAGVAVLLVAPRTVVTGLVVAVLLALGYVLDSADGQLARLRGDASPAGEWLDHLLDAVRAPGIHLAAAVALSLDGGMPWLVAVALVAALMVTAQFANTMVGGMLRDRRGGERVAVRRGQSWLLLPTDTGATCWVFAFWGLPTVFAVAYTALVAVNLAHAAASIRHRYHELQAITSEPTQP